MEALKATKEAERSKAAAGIQKKRIQTLRKLTQARLLGDKVGDIEGKSDAALISAFGRATSF